jgi:hypothetical protein
MLDGPESSQTHLVMKPYLGADLSHVEPQHLKGEEGPSGLAKRKPASLSRSSALTRSQSET